MTNLPYSKVMFTFMCRILFCQLSAASLHLLYETCHFWSLVTKSASFMMAGKIYYWLIAFLFVFSLDPITSVQINNTANSSTLATTSQASTAASSTTPQATTTLPTPSSPTAMPAIFITLSFTISWQRFCPLSEKFRNKLSNHLIEQDENKVIHVISNERICYMNIEQYCEENSYGNGKAQVMMYISKKGDFSTVDEDMTIKAYRILDDYVVNKKMAKIDAVFADKVQYIRISGSKASETHERSSFTDFDKVAIGMGVSLVVIFLAVMIYRQRKSYLRQPNRQQAAQANRSPVHELQVLRPSEDA